MKFLLVNVSLLLSLSTNVYAEVDAFRMIYSQSLLGSAELKVHAANCAQIIQGSFQLGKDKLKGHNFKTETIKSGDNLIQTNPTGATTTVSVGETIDKREVIISLAIGAYDFEKEVVLSLDEVKDPSTCKERWLKLVDLAVASMDEKVEATPIKSKVTSPVRGTSLLSR